MGFRPKRASFKLDFSGTEYEGLEITVRPMPMSVMLDMSASVASAAQDGSTFRQVVATLAYAMESWNLEDQDGQPVAADPDGLMSQDSEFLTAVIKAWMESAYGASQ